jgi:hypothetical protein
MLRRDAVDCTHWRRRSSRVTRTARWPALIASSRSAPLGRQNRSGARRSARAVLIHVLVLKSTPPGLPSCAPPARQAVPSLQSDRCRFGEETFAGASSNGSNAPIPVARGTAMECEVRTQSCRPQVGLDGRVSLSVRETQGSSTQC